MKNGGKNIEEILRQGLNDIEVPENLRKEKIVEMLREQKDFSDETGNIIEMDAHRDSASKPINAASAVRRLAAAAAAVIVVFVSVMFAKVNTGVRIIRTEPTFINYNAENLVVGVSSYEEVEFAVQSILKKDKADRVPDATHNGDDSSATAVQNSAPSGQSNAYVIDNSVMLETAVNAYNTSSEIVESLTGLEADIVKNNDEYLFVATTGLNANGANAELIKVIKALPAEEMSVASTIVLSDNSSSKCTDDCIEIYLKGNKLIAIMSRDAYVMEDSSGFSKASTVAVYYDISNPSEPVRIREHVQDGEYIVSGITESGALYLITEKAVSGGEQSAIPVCTADGKEVKPATDKIFMAVNDPEAAFTFITVTNTDDLTQPVDSLAFFGSNSGRLWVSGNTVMISRGFISVEADENGAHKNLTELYRFNIGESKVELVGSYVFKGFLSDKPVVDEATGWLTAVATDSDFTTLYILNEKMEFVSGVDNIFPGEKVKGAKVIEKNCYVISGSATETTMIIDISDANKPRKVATVATNGLADRLFSAGGEKLIHIGASDAGSELLKGISISLLDLSDPSRPGSLDLYNLSDISDTLSVFDNGGIMIMQDENILGIPVIRTDSETKETALAYALFELTQSDIKPVGYFNHETGAKTETAMRGTCIGDIFYSITGSKIVAFSISGESRLGSIELN